jgi:hypothetical protein
VTVLVWNWGDVPVSSQTAGRSGDYRRRTGPCVSVAILDSFLSAATDLPFAEESFTIGWLFLGVGALAGSAIWIRSNRTQHFGVSIL